MALENTPLLAWIEDMQTRLYNKARQLVDEFDTEHLIHKDTPTEGRYGVRAMKGKVGISIHWHVTQFRKTPDGKSVAHYRHIKRGPNARYKLSQFKRMQPWEKELAKHIEERAALIRRQSEGLESIWRTAWEGDKRLARYEEQFKEKI